MHPAPHADELGETKPRSRAIVFLADGGGKPAVEREKVHLLARTGDPAAGMRDLAKHWMESEPEEAGYLYVDDHLRVYHGEQARLPKRYVSRQRLCRRGTTDYLAETAMVALLRRHLKKKDDARALIRELFVPSADIEPNALANTLTIKIHRMVSPAHDRAIAALLEKLTLQDFPHPETGARITFTVV